MPKDLEVRFALSALPPHLRTGGTVYVLDPATGYVLDRKGTNGFSCIVERTEWVRAEFRNDIYTALCYDEEGSRNHLRVYMDTAAMRAKGLSAGAVKQEIARRFANKTYVAPKRMGLSYMVAPLIRFYVFYIGKLIAPGLDHRLLRRAMIKSMLNPVLHLVAILLAWVDTTVSLVLYAAIPVLFLVPTRLEHHSMPRKPE